MFLCFDPTFEAYHAGRDVIELGPQNLRIENTRRQMALALKNLRVALELVRMLFMKMNCFRI
jgi:hypothetical protein